jgi:hypothetical protein
LSNELGNGSVWMCPGLGAARLLQATQAVQNFQPGDPAAMTGYWLWRFDRISSPVQLDNFWDKTTEQALADLRAAGNPAVGKPDAASDVELAVDVYFPGTIPTVAPPLAGRAVHARGRNRLMLDLSASFWLDPRLSANN